MLARDALPALDERGVKLLAVGIGTPKRAVEFSSHVGFPLTNLYADPENAAYEALGLELGVASTFFQPTTPLAILDRITSDAGPGDLAAALSRWRPWIPPKLEQGLQQGGTFVFHGQECVYEHRDVSTGAHATLADVLAAAVRDVRE